MTPPENDRTRIVPYAPFTTFLSTIEAMERGIHHRIDASVWPTYSKAIRSQLLGTFRFFDLIDKTGKPTPTLKSLVQNKANRKVTFRKLLEASYSAVVALDLTRVSPRQFDEAMREYGMSGATHKKVVSFFLRAAKYAELPMSPLLGRRVRERGPRRRVRTGEIIGPASELSAVPESQRTSKTIALRSGGSVTLKVDGSYLEMTTADRQFISDLIDRLQGYEKRKDSD